MQEILSVDITAPSYTSGWGPFNDKRSVLNNDVRTLIEEGRSLFGATDVLMGVTMHEGYMYFTDDEIENGITAFSEYRGEVHSLSKKLSFHKGICRTDDCWYYCLVGFFSDSLFMDDFLPNPKPFGDQLNGWCNRILQFARSQ